MRTLVFDEKCTAWRENIGTNRVYLHYQIEYIYGTLKERGYIYLNQIYELLGAKWDPNFVNVCYMLEDRPRIECGLLHDNIYVVKIY